MKEKGSSFEGSFQGREGGGAGRTSLISPTSRASGPILNSRSVFGFVILPTYSLHCSSFFWFNQIYNKDPRR